MFRDCLSNTTVHGIPHLVNDKNKSMSKLIWFVIIFASTGAFVYHSTSLIWKYSQKDKFVSHSLDSEKFIIPDIYICNNRPFSYALMEKLHSENNSIFLEMLNRFKNNSFIDIPLAFNRCYPGYSKKQTLEMLSNRNFTDCLASSFDYYYYCLSCPEVLDQVIDTRHGYCYKLKDKYKHLIYERKGITFIWYTDDYGKPYMNMYESVHEFFGHTVYFTIPGYAPNDDSSSLSIRRGWFTEIDVTMKLYDKYKHENNSYKSCQDNPIRGTYILDWNYPESLSLSYLFKGYDFANRALHEYILNKCNCSWALIPLDIEIAHKFKNKMCGNKLPDNTLFQSCIDDVLKTKQFLHKWSHFDPCKMPIYSAVYKSAPVTDDWITTDLDSLVFENYNKGNTVSNSLKTEYIKWRKNRSDNVGQIPEKFKNSLSWIVIKAPKKTADLWKENLSYELKDLLADISGILGFYLGVSMVSLLEIFAHIPNYCINDHY